MKITQEVREFADSAANTGRPGDGRTLELAERSAAGDGDFAAKQNASADPFLAVQDAEKGMAEMSKRFRKEGGELYVSVSDGP
jgi:hypothetical protein